jgi:hypothetical protein
MKNVIQIKTQDNGSIIAKVYSRGNVYAIRYAEGSEVTEAEIRKVWKEERRAFRPFDESLNSFCQ